MAVTGAVVVAGMVEAGIDVTPPNPNENLEEEVEAAAELKTVAFLNHSIIIINVNSFLK